MGWTVVAATIREELSALYDIALVLSQPIPGDGPQGLLDAAARLTIERPGALEHRIHGVVCAVEDLGATASQRYVRARMVPRLWALSQRSDSRIFQDVPVADIVRAVLLAAGLYDGARGALDAPEALDALPPREYCAQYRERDLDFVMRLLQEEGVPFYFRDDRDGFETLVLAQDAPSWPAPELMARGGTVHIVDAFQATDTEETVRVFDLAWAQRPTSTTVREYDFTRPDFYAVAGTVTSPSGAGPRPLYEYPARAGLFQYEPPRYTQYDGSRQARIRQEAEAVPAATARGVSNVTGLRAGVRVRLEGHHAFASELFLLTSVEHTYQAWEDLAVDVRMSARMTQTLTDAGVRPRPHGEPRYENRFTVIPAAVPFRPERRTPRPIVHGLQTARVTGPTGEEIHVDLHGRIQVHFHWDRQSPPDAPHSCWLRCAQVWAGPAWGFQFIPRVGMEVVVAFLEGDPDRPLVTGCVYNGVNNTPYPLPDEKTRSALKTWSSPATGGYNELRFEDAAGQEQVYLQAERDHHVFVKNDQLIEVHRNRTKVIGGYERNTVVFDRATVVQGNESKEVVGDQDVQVQGGDGARLTIDHHYRVSADDSLSLKVGDSSVVMTPSEIHLSARTIKVHGGKLVDIKAELVKINCPEEPAKKAAEPQKKKSKLQKLVEKVKSVVKKIKARVNKILDKLPKPLARLLRKVFKDGFKGVMTALLQGKLPDFKALGREALGTALATARVTAQNAIGRGLQGLAQLPGLRDIPGIDGLARNAQGRLMQYVNRGLNAVGGFVGIVGDNPAWYRFARDYPRESRDVIEAIGHAPARQELPAAPVPGAVARAGGADAWLNGQRTTLRESARAAADAFVTRHAA